MQAGQTDINPSGFATAVVAHGLAPILQSKDRARNSAVWQLKQCFNVALRQKESKFLIQFTVFSARVTLRTIGHDDKSQKSRSTEIQAGCRTARSRQASRAGTRRSEECWALGEREKRSGEGRCRVEN
ncbi:MAG: hypothetical protein V4637_16205 [Pseudomonadota bacterium]